MNDYQSLRTEHILYGLDCMMSFAEFSNGQAYGVDLEAGVITAGEESVPLGIVGSWAGPPTSSWLWGWANPGWQGLPDETLAPANALKGLGELLGIGEFVSPELPMDNDTFGFEVTAIACGLTSAAGAFQHQHSGGSAFFILPSLPRCTSELGSRHVTVIMQGIQAYEVSHRPAVASYLTKVGYTVVESPTEIVATQASGVLTASFDDIGRLTNLEGSLAGGAPTSSADPAMPAPPTEPKPGTEAPPSDSGGFLSRFRKKN